MVKPLGFKPNPHTNQSYSPVTTHYQSKQSSVVTLGYFGALDKPRSLIRNLFMTLNHAKPDKPDSLFHIYMAWKILHIHLGSRRVSSKGEHVCCSDWPMMNVHTAILWLLF